MPILIQGFNYDSAENFVRKYCADCHAPGGLHSEQEKATTLFLLDNYAQWHRREQKIKFRLDTATLQSFPELSMPPDSLPFNRKPTITERLAMMKWIDSLSPNTPDGSGHGEAPSTAGIIMEGAMEGTVYDTAFKLVNRYCADCHTQGGLSPYQPSGWNYVMRLDTYQNWVDGSISIEERLDVAMALQNGYEAMPPSYAPFEPTDSERQVLLDWLRRGSPNTDSGR
jgi:cytochrome c